MATHLVAAGLEGNVNVSCWQTGCFRSCKFGFTCDIDVPHATGQKKKITCHRAQAQGRQQAQYTDSFADTRHYTDTRLTDSFYGRPLLMTIGS